MSIYTELLNAVNNGSKFRVDLIKKSLWINKRQIIMEEEIVNEQDQGKELIEDHDLDEHVGYYAPLSKNPWTRISILYDKYKHSVPSKNGMKKCYFKALPVEELTDAELAYNADRNYCQAILEGYILLGSLAGWLKWEHETHWFWKSETDEELVVLKQWIK